MAKAVGIDLGTTFSVVAYIDEDGKPKIIRNRDGDNVTPSVVNFDENGEPLVGRLAKEMSTEQDGTVLFVKNEMGNPEWKILVGTEEYNPETVSSIILKRLKEDAESILGEEIKDVVITVPAYFGDAQRLSTTQAGKIAGFNVLKIINEPTAAALAYGFDSGKDETLLVFDLGGGTFDVTIMRIENKDIRVLATGGNRELGGRNWDNEIINYLRDLVLSDEGIDLFEQEHGTSRLRKLAESAKIALSDKQNTPVNINLGNGKRKKIDLTREKFNELTASLNSQTIDVAEFTMEEAKLGWKDIDKFLLVGGSTRMPIIRELIEKHSGKKPSAELHPDEVVAMGAALQAAIILAGEKRADLSPEVLYGLPPAPKDVCSRGLGITARNRETHIMENSIIMQRNTEIPGKRNQRYHTVEDNQTSLRVQVNEGDEKDLEYVIKIGEATMKLEPRPKDSPLDVSVEYDENQIVHINVYDGVNNKHLGEIKIERKSNMDDVQVGKLTDLIQKTSVN